MAACSSTTDDATSTANAADGSAADATGVRVVDTETAAAILNQQPDGLVVLDVRTPEEYAEGHLEGATLLDFYRDDFADQLAGLDPNLPYLLYCRSGNRSSQARAMMADLGFTDVADIDGGIAAWTGAGLPVVQ